MSKCHPLGHAATEKRCPSRFFHPVLTEALSCILQAVIEPAFSFVSIPYLPRRPTDRRGDPFSHPSGSSALRRPIPLDLNFEPKGAGRDCSRSRLPPARFSWSVLTIDTNPPPAFTRCATNMLNAERGVWSEPAPEVALMRQTAAMGIGILAHGYYRQGMKTLTMKVPDELLGWLEHEAGRAGQPKSALVREILRQHQRRRHQSLSIWQRTCAAASGAAWATFPATGST
jgi:hypothetical protein